MAHYSIYEAKTHLSRLIKDALSGKKIVITHRGVPQVELTPVKAKSSGKRTLGQVKGEYFIADDFDAPLEDFSDYTE